MRLYSSLPGFLFVLSGQLWPHASTASSLLECHARYDSCGPLSCLVFQLSNTSRIGLCPDSIMEFCHLLLHSSCFQSPWLLPFKTRLRTTVKLVTSIFDGCHWRSIFTIHFSQDFYWLFSAIKFPKTRIGSLTDIVLPLLSYDPWKSWIQQVFKTKLRVWAFWNSDSCSLQKCTTIH